MEGCAGPVMGEIRVKEVGRVGLVGKRMGEVKTLS